MFLKAFPIINGTVASIAYPVSNDKPARFLIPAWILANKAAGSILKTSYGTILPLS